MQSRGKSMSVEPVSVISASLTSNPVSSVAAARAVEAFGASFSTVLAEAVDASQSGRRQKGIAVRIDAGQEGAQPLRPVPSLLQYNTTIDLYVQLDTLLREKSMLIAIV